MLNRWIILTLSILACTYLIPGVEVRSFWAAMGAAAILGIMNALVKPIIVFFTIPLSCLTLGLFLLVINGAMFWMMSLLAEDWIYVAGFKPALLAGIVVSIIGSLSGGKKHKDA